MAPRESQGAAPALLAASIALGHKRMFEVSRSAVTLSFDAAAGGRYAQIAVHCESPAASDKLV